MCEIMPFLYNSININFDFIGLMLQRAHTHTHTHIQLLMMFNSWDKKGATKYKEEEKKFMGCVKRKRKRYIEDILRIYIYVIVSLCTMESNLNDVQFEQKIIILYRYAIFNVL